MENGLDDVMRKEQIENTPESKVAGSIEPIRVVNSYAYWEVGGVAYKMKLSTSMVCRIEEKYKTNLLNLMSGGIPRLSVMLTIIQGALADWNHGISYKNVQEMYEQYVEEGGDQTKFMADILMSVLSVSGFFPQEMAQNIREEIEMSQKML